MPICRIVPARCEETNPVLVRTVDLSDYAGVRANGITDLDISPTSDGFYTVAFTGAGGNARDQLQEQAQILYEVLDLDGEVVDLVGKTHILHYFFENRNWIGTNSAIYNAGLFLGNGTGLDDPGDIQGGSWAVGFALSSRGLSSSWIGGQTAPGSGYERVDQVWVPPRVGNTRGLIGYTAETATASTSGALGGDTTDISAVTVAALCLSVGNDYSLTSGGAFSEEVRLRYALVPNPSTGA